MTKTCEKCGTTLGLMKRSGERESREEICQFRGEPIYGPPNRQRWTRYLCSNCFKRGAWETGIIGAVLVGGFVCVGGFLFPGSVDNWRVFAVFIVAAMLVAGVLVAAVLTTGWTHLDDGE